MIVPTTEWLQPEEFPDLRNHSEIAIDLETRDPDLKSKGSGSIIGEGANSWYSCCCGGLVRLFSNSSW